MRIRKISLSGFKSFDQVSVELAGINVLIGENNSGKSTLLKAAYLLQPGSLSVRNGDIRLGSPNAVVTYELADYKTAYYSAELASETQVKEAAPNGIIPLVDAEVVVTPQANGYATLSFVLRLTGVNQWAAQPKISPQEPFNFIYPYLSKRKVQSYDKGVDEEKASQVSGTLQHLSAKVARLAVPGQPGAERFAELCRELLHLSVASVPVIGGQLVGFRVGRYGVITIEDMGEGVASILGLIIDLCVAEDQLFLIEEPENDIHPAGLKSLLEAIVESSKKNQFIVSTHSNIVVKYLASAPNSKLFNVTQVRDAESIPTSQVKTLTSPSERSQALRDLGYDLHDFDLAEGWLILEEASAEIFIREYLIPWFAPKLARIRTVSCQGTGNVEPTFKEFSKLVLFIHREELLRERAWVVVDGDASGLETTEKLKGKYSDWPKDRFINWQKEQFEEYYPDQFSGKAQAALAQRGADKRQAKNDLRQEVQEWCDDNPDEAKAAFAVSAEEVIKVLKAIEGTLFRVPGSTS